MRKTSAKSQAQQALRRERTKTDSTLVKPRLIALPSATTKKVKAKLKVGAAQSPVVLTSMLDKSLVTAKNLKPEAEAQEVAKARASKSTATRASRAHQVCLCFDPSRELFKSRCVSGETSIFLHCYSSRYRICSRKINSSRLLSKRTQPSRLQRRQAELTRYVPCDTFGVPSWCDANFDLAS